MFSRYYFNGIEIAVRNYYSALLSIEINGQKMLKPLNNSNGYVLSFETDYIDLCIVKLEARGCSVIANEKEEVVFRDPYNLFFRIRKSV